MSSSATKIGDEGEQIAVDYLVAKGYKILGRKYACNRGELDIVAQTADVLVFAEVKNYSESSYHDALDALTPKKIKKIIAAAHHYLYENDIADDMQVRFDVVAIDRKGGAITINHIPDAFEADG